MLSNTPFNLSKSIPTSVRPDVRAAAVKLLKERLPADPMTVALGLESTVLPGLNLISHVDAMTHIHKPQEWYQVFQARERLAFEELLLVQTRFLQERDRALKKSGEAGWWCALSV